MGKETASALARWCNLEDVGVNAELTAVCDLQPAVLDWFRRISSVRLFTADAAELLASPDVDAVYVAVPHHLHEELYLQVLRAGKDLLAEKPFGIDLAAARRVRDEAARLGRFVRCSSEFPFYPGPWRIFNEVRAGRCGRLIEVKAGFLHASDLDPDKPINWKRQARFCGAAGVMNDLGMHAAHLPLRLGWKPGHLYARLQKLVTERPDGKGGRAVCDTWENALLSGEWAGVLGKRFGCATPDEAVATHELWTAALASNREHKVVSLTA